MASVRVGGEKVRQFILDNLDKHPNDIARVTAEHFGITRQAVNRHLKNLLESKSIIAEGNTQAKVYLLAPKAEKRWVYQLTPALAEDVVWRKDIAPAIGQLPANVLEIWHYGFTEMFNNALDHSGAKAIVVTMVQTAASTHLRIYDNGVGIFRKIQDAFQLIDARHAILELAKGKLTTDPARHSGEGIFFTSRAFDSFDILSDGGFFSHEFGDEQDWMLEHKDEEREGTLVRMELNNHTSRTLKEVFDQYSTDNDYSFSKTVVPVRLAQYGDDQLVSRSQAKRLLNRVERFRTVLIDFEGVESIGQSFADEIFRVFVNEHPEVSVVENNANPSVAAMISRARAANKQN